VVHNISEEHSVYVFKGQTVPEQLKTGLLDPGDEGNVGNHSPKDAT
jgi:hypothetical protein